MYYLYHKVPKAMSGAILYPLNQLKSIYPDSFAVAVAKYSGREHIMEQPIPTLNCLWNDAIHLTAIPPASYSNALAQAGLSHEPVSYYQIDPKLLNAELMTVYIYTNLALGKDALKNEQDFKPFDLKNLQKYSVIPESTLQYYKDVSAKNERPLLNHGVTHIFYKGTISVEGIPIVTA